MQDLFGHSGREDASEARQGVVAIAALMIGIALVLGLYTVLLFLHAVPLTSAAWLVGVEVATLGPVILALHAAAFALAAFGIWKQKRWARWLTLALMAWGFVQEIPAISMAVADERYLRMLRAGVGIIVRVAVCWYLLQEHVRESFE